MPWPAKNPHNAAFDEAEHGVALAIVDLLDSPQIALRKDFSFHAG